MARLLSGTTRTRTEVSPAQVPRAAVTAPPAPDLDRDPTGRVPVVAGDGALVDPGGAVGSKRPTGGGTDGGAVAPDGSGGGRRRLLRRQGQGDRGGLDLRNTWQVVAGSILVPVGIVIILIAWYGSAHTRYVQQQIPYLVSGSFIGLGCMVLGGLLYWAHWLYRIYDQADLNHEELMKAFEQTLRVVADRLAPPIIGGSVTDSVVAAGPGPSGSSGGTRHAAPGAPPATYVATASGTVYHLPSCPVVAHHGDGLRALAPGDVAAMEPCRICLVAGRQ